MIQENKKLEILEERIKDMLKEPQKNDEFKAGWESALRWILVEIQELKKKQM